jgi:hypothetical protein
MQSNQQLQSNERGLDQWLSEADQFARREPVKAVASAFGAGFLINLLPLGALVGTVATLAFALARPVLLFLGLMKAFELTRERFPGIRQP